MSFAYYDEMNVICCEAMEERILVASGQPELFKNKDGNGKEKIPHKQDEYFYVLEYFPFPMWRKGKKTVYH